MFHVPKSIEATFGHRLGRVFSRLMGRIKSGKIPVEQAIREFGFTKGANKYIDTAIEKMINAQRVSSAVSWKDMASRKSRIARSIRTYLKGEMKNSVGRRVGELIGENAMYIKSLPDNWADYASKMAFRMTMQGKTPEEIEAQLRKKIPEHMRSNLKLIARTESAKANAAIAQARAEDLGIPCYIWRTCKDERVRPSHRRMEGVLCFWNNPPSPEGMGFYHPGNTYNCRCYAEPVLDFDSLPKSMKMWTDSGVKRVYGKTMQKYKNEYGGW